MTESRSDQNHLRSTRPVSARSQSLRSVWRRAGRPAALALALAALAVPLALAAGPHGRGGHGGHHGGPGMHGGGDVGAMLEHLADRLELTEAQRDAARQVLEDRRDALHAGMEALHQRHEALRDASQAAPIDEGAIRAAGDALGVASADVALLRAEMHQELMAILTPEQRTELDALHAERETRREEHRARRQERRDRRSGSAPDA